jgi:REP element-mobilizing transposase RayT
VRFDGAARKIVAGTIQAHCDIRKWTLLATAVRTNHIHVVVACAQTDPLAAIEQFKAWATRRLREAGLFGADADVWTPRGSRRYLWNERAVADAVVYVEEMQGRPLD